jgi:PKD repeat protein
MPPGGVLFFGAAPASEATSNDLSQYLEAGPGGLLSLRGVSQPGMDMNPLTHRLNQALQGLPQDLPKLSDVFGPNGASPDAVGEIPVRVFPPGAPETLTGTQVVDANWIVQHDLTLDHATVTFKTTERQHHSIILDPGVKLTILDSTIKQNEGNRLAYGLITVQGELKVERSSFSEIALRHFATATDDGFTSYVVDSTFNNIGHLSDVVGAITTTSKITIARNVFTRNFDAVQIGLGCCEEAAAPNVNNNTFEMNEFAIRILGGGAGTYKHNRITANAIGVFCWTIAHPLVQSNNIDENYADALAGSRAVSIILPNGEQVSLIDDSVCDYDGNYYGGAGANSDSFFLSESDTNTNIQGSALSLSAPPLPFPRRIITAATTWNAANPPPTINGPVIVKSGGSLTISGITLDMKGFTLGSKINGQLDMTNVDIIGTTSLYVRNDDDVLSDVELRDPVLFAGVHSNRNSGTIDNVRILNAGQHAMGFMLNAGQLTDDEAWTPTLQNSKVVNAQVGVMTIANKPTIDGNTFEDIGNMAIWMQFAQGTVSDNVATRAVSGAGGTIPGSTWGSFQLATMSSSGNRFEGGIAGFFSAALNTLTFTNDVFANNVIGLFTQLDTNPTVTTSLLAHNLMGLGIAAGTVTVTNSDIIDNYGVGLLTIDVDILGNGAGAGAIACTNCFLPDDESREGTVQGTFALAANAGVPHPDWWADRVSITAGTHDLTGTLDGPVIVRKGAKLRALDATVDLNGFNVGAKGGGPDGAFTTGIIEIRRSDITNGGGLMMNSTDVVIEYSSFSNSVADLMASYQNMPTVTCSRLSGAIQSIWTFKGGASPLTFDRVLMDNVGSTRVGFDRRIPGWAEDAEIHNSGFSDVGTAIGRSGVGTVAAHGNNFLTVNTGYSELGFDVDPEARGDVTDNYWYHSTGPYVRIYDTDGATLLQEPNKGFGARANLEDGANSDQWAFWSPFRTAPKSQTPCLDFRFNPGSPTEIQTATFTDRSFDPSGVGIASHKWSWGDGTPDTTTTAATATHRFPDGGTYTVTLTVTTELGASASLSKVVAVSHVKPTPNFSSAATNELSPVSFTDTSTHPNSPRDDPPTGWTYSWNFNGEGTSSARNPSFDFADGGSKTITLTVTDNDGQTNNVQKTVSVAHVAPIANFAVTGTLETDTYTLTDTSTHPNAPVDGITSRSWSCSDDFTSTAANPTHKFPDGPSASCTLTVGDNDGQSNAITKSFGVAHVAPDANFATTGDDELDNFQFTDTSTHPNAPRDAPPAGWTYSWDFNGEGSSSARNPTFNFADGGAKTISLTATDNDGLSNTETKTVTVAHVAPIADFTFTPANQEPGLPVSFSDASTHPNAPVDSIVSYSWDFDGLGSSTDQNPSFVFDTLGQYFVTLTVTDDDGLSDSITIGVPIGNNPPVAVLNFDPQDPTTLDTVDFDGSDSFDPDGTIVSYHWDLGDGTTADTATVSHQFDDGTWTVVLTVTDNLGSTGTASVVLEIANILPNAGFHTTPPTPVANAEVTFNDDSNDPDGDVVSWDWDLGDGTTSTEQSPTHTYTAGGDYTVSLTVTDDDGGVDTITKNVHVCETQLLDEEGHLHLEICTVITLDFLLDLVQAVLDLITADEAAPAPAPGEAVLPTL